MECIKPICAFIKKIKWDYYSLFWDLMCNNIVINEVFCGLSYEIYSECCI